MNVVDLVDSGDIGCRSDMGKIGDMANRGDVQTRSLGSNGPPNFYCSYILFIIKNGISDSLTHRAIKLVEYKRCQRI